MADTNFSWNKDRDLLAFMHRNDLRIVLRGDAKKGHDIVAVRDLTITEHKVVPRHGLSDHDGFAFRVRPN